ncbi:MAG: tyrosine-type recombinase/integrase [bacterium]
MDNRLYGIKEVSELLDVEEATIYAWTHYKKIPFIKVGRLVKFEASKIQEWKDKMPSCEGKILSNRGMKILRKEKQDLNSQQFKTIKPCKLSSGNSRKGLTKGVYRLVNKSGVKYGIDYFDPVSCRRIKKIISSDPKEAERAYRKVQVEIEDGNWEGNNHKAPLFETFVATYLECCRTQDSKTHYIAKVQCLTKEAAKAFNGIRIDQISIAMIEKFKNQRANTVSNATVNRGLSYLRHFFNKAIDYGYLKSNPCSKVKFFKEPPGLVRWLTKEQIVILLDNCPEEIKPVVIIALNCGLRKSEIFALKWQDVDMQNRYITVQHSKSNKKRMIPINDSVYKVFENLPQTEDKIFRIHNFRILFERAVKSAGIEDFTFHSLRHCFASHLAMSGINLATIKELMGHSSIRMTLRYAHLCDGCLEDAVKKLQITP